MIEFLSFKMIGTLIVLDQLIQQVLTLFYKIFMQGKPRIFTFLKKDCLVLLALHWLRILIMDIRIINNFWTSEERSDLVVIDPTKLILQTIYAGQSNYTLPGKHSINLAIKIKL